MRCSNNLFSLLFRTKEGVFKLYVGIQKHVSNSGHGLIEQQFMMLNLWLA